MPAGKKNMEGQEMGSSNKPSPIMVSFVFLQLKVLSVNAFCVRGNTAGAMATSVMHCCSISLFLSLPLLSLWWAWTHETCLFSNKINIATSCCHFHFPFPTSLSLSSHQLLDCSWSTFFFLHIQAWCCQNLHAEIASFALKLSLVYCYISE